MKKNFTIKFSFKFKVHAKYIVKKYIISSVAYLMDILI